VRLALSGAKGGRGKNPKARGAKRSKDKLFFNSGDKGIKRVIKHKMRGDKSARK